MINRIKTLLTGKSALGWSGNYKSWEEASNQCTNYDDNAILDKVKNALLEVKYGRAAFERDSVLFHQAEYNWPFLASLMWAFSKERQLTIIDFGGSLGSTYFQHRKWMDGLQYSWNIIEQPNFVEAGKASFEDDRLKFFDIVEEVKNECPTFLILSSVLAYLPVPYTWLSKLLDLKYDYVFIDRTPLVKSADRLTIQRVPKDIYDASYPAWFFNEGKFTAMLEEKYEIVSDHRCNEKANFPAVFQGFFMKLK